MGRYRISLLVSEEAYGGFQESKSGEDDGAGQESPAQPAGEYRVCKH